MVYADYADEYYRAGFAPLPLPPGQKAPVPSGFTGWDGVTPEPEQIQRWKASRATSNIGLRLPDGVLGIDVDAYHGGGETLAGLEERLGKLPDAPLCTSRDDGSGIRLFRVPPSVHWVGNIPPGVEIIQHGHRYVVAPPSMHPDTGRPYAWWWQRDGELFTGMGFGIPVLDTLPWLPDNWVEYLRDARERTAEDGYTGSAAEWFNSVPPGEPCRTLDVAVETRIWDLQHGDTRHDAMNAGVAEVVKLGAEGHVGARSALSRLGIAFVAAVGDDRDGADIEYKRSVRGAISKYGALSGNAACDCDAEPSEADQYAEIAERFAGSRISWEEFWAEERPPPVWLCEPLIEAGKQITIYSEPKAGKTLVTQDISARLSLGLPTLGRQDASIEPINVLYIDKENTEDDIYERLGGMGHKGNALSNLHYYSFPDLAFLDTREGGQELLALARFHDAKLVILDTTSRVVEGEENNNDTYHNFYKYCGVYLKKDRRALIRLDHSGKDAAKGMRGASSKTSDVDAVWQLVSPEGSDTVFLTRTHSRSNRGDSSIVLQRLDGPLRHVLDTPAADLEAMAEFPDMAPEDPVAEVLEYCAKHGLDLATLSVRALKDAIRELGGRFSNAAIEEAIREDRKARSIG